MAWRRKEDLGTQIVAFVHDQLRLDDEYVLDCGRSFVYWPHDQALTVSADLPNFHNAYSIFRLHAEVEVSHANGRHDEVALALADRMSRAALSALCYDKEKDVYRLHCSIYAHADNADWLRKVFLAAVGLQLARSRSLAQDLERILGLSSLSSSHPQRGRRVSPDPYMGAMDRFFQPTGAQPSRWLGSEEWPEAGRVIRRMALNYEGDDYSELSAEFHWIPNQPMALRVSAAAPHCELGNGLLLSLAVPWGGDPLELGTVAFALNALERRDWNWCHDLGAWCVFDGQLTFRCFVPNLCAAPGLLYDLCHDMALRARWLCDTAALELIGVEALA